MKTNWHTKFIGAASAVVFGGLVLGCSKQNQSVEEAAAEEVGGGGEQPLVLYTWGDYFPEEVLSQFNETTGIEVVLDTFDTLDEMMAKLRSEPGTVDVLIVDDSTISDIAALGLLEKIDRQLLSDLGNIDPAYMALPFDPKNQYSVPYLWGSTLVAYRADKIADPKKSWAELWNPAYKGYVMMLDEPEDLFCATLIERGFDRNSKTEAELAASKDRLMEQITEVEVRYG
ncbi:MAG: extracellular solute-binding protein, partial [Verrucomicrobiales bacterium]|nr:extracellular solute-binding protein [Verrucomicrobiales bacterium]